MTKKFYHWALKGNLQVNQELKGSNIKEFQEYQKFLSSSEERTINLSNKIESYIDDMYSSLFNPRGMNVMLTTLEGHIPDRIQELILEQTRLIINKELPSRLNSFMHLILLK